MKSKSLTRIILILTLVFLNLSCDQVSKRIVRKKISTNERIEVIKDNFILTKVENSGAAYSWGSNFSPLIKKIILQIIPAVVLLVLLVMLLVNRAYSKEISIGFSFIVGGGIGNIFDRIAYGSVTDFMYVDLGFFNTEIFNMADVSIVIGTLIVLTYSFFGKKEKPDLEEELV